MASLAGSLARFSSPESTLRAIQGPPGWPLLEMVSRPREARPASRGTHVNPLGPLMLGLPTRLSLLLARGDDWEAHSARASIPSKARPMAQGLVNA